MLLSRLQTGYDAPSPYRIAIARESSCHVVFFSYIVSPGSLSRAKCQFARINLLTFIFHVTYFRLIPRTPGGDSGLAGWLAGLYRDRQGGSRGCGGQAGGPRAAANNIDTTLAGDPSITKAVIFYYVVWNRWPSSLRKGIVNFCEVGRRPSSRLTVTYHSYHATQCRKPRRSKTRDHRAIS